MDEIGFRVSGAHESSSSSSFLSARDEPIAQFLLWICGALKHGGEGSRRYSTNPLFFIKKSVFFCADFLLVVGVRREMGSAVLLRRLEGKVAVITASTQGIGFAIARRLALEGAAVVISSRKQVGRLIPPEKRKIFLPLSRVCCLCVSRADVSRFAVSVSLVQMSLDLGNDISLR